VQFYTRGRARSSIGDYAGAIADFDRVLSLAPSATAVYGARADAYDALGQHDRAAADRANAAATPAH
jgi:tetratricopeptide (TPR) repeat protein